MTMPSQSPHDKSLFQQWVAAAPSLIQKGETIDEADVVAAKLADSYFDAAAKILLSRRPDDKVTTANVIDLARFILDVRLANIVEETPEPAK